MSATKIEKAASNNTKVQDMGLLEEDDEFEEFPNEGKGGLIISSKFTITRPAFVPTYFILKLHFWLYK